MKYKILIGVGVFLLLVVLVFATKETTQEYSVNTQIEFTKSTINLNTIKIDSIARVTLPIKNNTPNPLLIMNIEKSTDDIILDQTPQVFRYNEPVEINFLYNAKKIGIINEFITIKGNFSKRELKLPIIGKVVK